MTRRLVLLGLLVMMLVLPQQAAHAANTIEINAEIGGRDVASADSARPILIKPREEIPLRLTIRNRGTRTETIRYVRLEGKALGLTFLTYDLGLRTSLRPGEQTTIDTVLDFFDLDNQATGYLGTSLRVYDANRQLLGSKSFVLDVRGKATSTLGLFAVAVVAVAIFSGTVLVLNTLRRRLASNRFVRGVQFSMTGAAIGLTLSLGVSILRIAFADVEAWVPVVFVPTVIAFAVGYIAPGPLSRSIRDVRDEEALQFVAERVVARASGMHDPATSGAFSPISDKIDAAIALAEGSAADTPSDEPAADEPAAEDAAAGEPAVEVPAVEVPAVEASGDSTEPEPTP